MASLLPSSFSRCQIQPPNPHPNPQNLLNPFSVQIAKKERICRISGVLGFFLYFPGNQHKRPNHKQKRGWGVGERNWRFYFLLPTFFCASLFLFFFALSAPPFPTQFSGTSDLLFLVEKRQPAGLGFGDGSGGGRPTGKKGKSIFSGARKKVSLHPLTAVIVL